jgi:hypothetical protein
MTELDLVGSHHDRLEAGRADLVDGGADDGGGETGANGGLTGRGLTNVRRNNVAHDDLVDGVSTDLGTLKRGLDGNGTKLRSRHTGEGAVERTKRGTDSGNNANIRVVDDLGGLETSRSAHRLHVKKGGGNTTLGEHLPERSNNGDDTVRNEMYTTKLWGHVNYVREYGIFS